MLSFFKPKLLFSDTEMAGILNCVRESENNTSGEIRIYIEEKCAYVDPILRAQEIFTSLKMQETENRNAVLIYIAHKDHDFALICDKALFEITTQAFWSHQSALLAIGFAEKKYTESLSNCVTAIGEELKKHFPFHGDNKNELPDEIIFGK